MAMANIHLLIPWRVSGERLEVGEGSASTLAWTSFSLSFPFSLAEWEDASSPSFPDETEVEVIGIRASVRERVRETEVAARVAGMSGA